jgi:hypothetical protein
MTYIPKKVLERQKWLTLPEAISHMTEVEKCTQNAAWQQLRAALADETVRTIYELFEDQLNSQDPTYWYKKPFPHLSAREFWMAISIDLEAQHIWFPDATFPLPIERIWLFKESILEIWKDQVLAGNSAKEKVTRDEILNALQVSFKKVEKGEIDQWDQNDLHKWVRGIVKPKTVTKKDVMAVFRKESEFSCYQRKKGRPRK